MKLDTLAFTSQKSPLGINAQVVFNFDYLTPLNKLVLDMKSRFEHRSVFFGTLKSGDSSELGDMIVLNFWAMI